QQQIHHHPGRQVPHPLLHPARLRQRLVDHLERDDPGQLAQMAGRERPGGNNNFTRNDRLGTQRSSRRTVIFVDTVLAGAPSRCRPIGPQAPRAIYTGLGLWVRAGPWVPWGVSENSEVLVPAAVRRRAPSATCEGSLPVDDDAVQWGVESEETGPLLHGGG